MTTPRSQPTPRKEGMANIVSATIQLLENVSPQDITLRDVARESGHGHRLIVEWFGGKGGLFDAVFREIFTNLSLTGDLFYADVATRADVRKAIQIFNYMQMHHRDFVTDARDNFVADALRARLIANYGLSEEKARITVERIAVLIIGMAAFGEFFGLSDDEIVRFTQDVFRVTTGHELPDNPARH